MNGCENMPQNAGASFGVHASILQQIGNDPRLLQLSCLPPLQPLLVSRIARGCQRLNDGFDILWAKLPKAPPQFTPQQPRNFDINGIPTDLPFVSRCLCP